jgi:hypothetical protein
MRARRSFGMSFRTVLVLSATAFSIAGCGNVTKRTVVDAINELVVKELREVIPDVRIGAIDCPDRIDVSGGRHERCSIVVEGRRYDVDVFADEAARQLRTVMQATLINVELIEKLGHADARRLGSPETRLDCGQPRIRVFAVGDHFVCTASRPGWTYEWKLKVENLRGLIYFENGFPARPGAGPDPRMTRLSPLLGQPTRVLDGKDAAELIRAASEPAEEDPGVHVGAVHCPPKVDVSDGKKGLCTVMVNDQPVRMRIEVKDGGWHTVADQAVFVMDAIERDAALSGEHKLQGHGDWGVHVHVDCGKPRMVVAEFPAERTCQATLSRGKPMPVHVLMHEAGERPSYYWGDVPTAH